MAAGKVSPKEVDAVIHKLAFAHGHRDLPGVVITGKINKPAVGDDDNGFDFTKTEFLHMAKTQPHKISVLLEHDKSRLIGRVLDIWEGESDDHLWATVIIDDSSRMGAEALHGVYAGLYRGFSIGNNAHGELFKWTADVYKIALLEISLVSKPDDPTAVLVAVGDTPERRQKVAYSLWYDIQRDLETIYEKMGKSVPSDVMRYVFDNQHLGALVNTLAMLSRSDSK